MMSLDMLVSLSSMLAFSTVISMPAVLSTRFPSPRSYACKSLEANSPIGHIVTLRFTSNCYVGCRPSHEPLHWVELLHTLDPASTSESSNSFWPGSRLVARIAVPWDLLHTVVVCRSPFVPFCCYTALGLSARIRASRLT